MGSEERDDDTGDEWLSWPDEADESDAAAPATGRPTVGDDDHDAAEASFLVGDDNSEVLPALAADISAGRIDNVPAAIGALSMRIDSLMAATTTYRSVMSDRMAEYAALVNRLNRTQVADLEEFRTANERTVGELRRSMAATEETLRNVAGQSDRLITDIAQMSEVVRNAAADNRDLHEATDKLGRFVTEALDQFADRVLNEVRAVSDSVTPEVSTLRSEVALARESIDDLNERASNRPVREAIDELRSDLSGLRRAVLEWPDLEVVRDAVVSLRADVSSLLERDDEGDVDASDADDARDQLLQLAVTEIAAIRSDLASITEDDQNEELARFVADLGTLRESVERLPDRADIVAELADLRASLTQVADSVAAPTAADDSAVIEAVAQLRDAVSRGPDLHGLVDELGAIEDRLATVPTVEAIRAEVRAAAIDAAAAGSGDGSEVAGRIEVLQDEMRAIRIAVDELREAMAEVRTEPVAAADTESIASELAALRDEVAAMQPTGAGAVDGVSNDALEELAKEVKALRRRIKVRVADDDEGPLGDARLQQIVDAVIDGLRAADG